MPKSKVSPIYSRYVKAQFSLLHHTGPIAKAPVIETKVCLLPVFDAKALIGSDTLPKSRKGIVYQLSEETLKLKPLCETCKHAIVTEGRALVKGVRVSKQTFAKVATYHKSCLLGKLFKVRTRTPLPEPSNAKPTVTRNFLPKMFQVAFKQEFGVVKQ